MALWRKRRRETGACGMNGTDEVSGQIQRTQNSCDEANQITHASFSFSAILLVIPRLLQDSYKLFLEGQSEQHSDKSQLET